VRVKRRGQGSGLDRVLDQGESAAGSLGTEQIAIPEAREIGPLCRVRQTLKWGRHRLPSVISVYAASTDRGMLGFALRHVK
jgi:hypothetical protein